MNTLLSVARFHWLNRLRYLWIPCGVTVFAFLVNFAINELLDDANAHNGGLLTVHAFLLFAGTLSVTRALPFGLALGLSRRDYYAGTLLFVLLLGLGYSVVFVLLRALEDLVGGWDGMRFFRLPWLFDQPWYLMLAASLASVLLVFCYGVLLGLVALRWDVLGVVLFAGAQVLLLLGLAALITAAHAWVGVIAFLLAAGAPLSLAVLAVLLAAAGFLFVRRISV